MSDRDEQAGVDIDSPIRERGDVPDEERAKALPPDAQDLHVDPDMPLESSAQPAVAMGTAVGQWRVAKSLLRLRDQVNAQAPHRSKASDGTIGDEHHCHGGAPTTSDHCPWVKDGSVGVVTAMDITNDPSHDCDSDVLAHSIVDSRDARVKYVISRSKIANSSPVGGSAAWAWRPYHGPDPHENHVHISVKSDKASYDATEDWNIELTS